MLQRNCHFVFTHEPFQSICKQKQQFQNNANEDMEMLQPKSAASERLQTKALDSTSGNRSQNQVCSHHNLQDWTINQPPAIVNPRHVPHAFDFVSFPICRNENILRENKWTESGGIIRKRIQQLQHDKHGCWKINEKNYLAGEECRGL